jgi:hypothetical protein
MADEIGPWRGELSLQQKISKPASAGFDRNQKRNKQPYGNK